MKHFIWHLIALQREQKRTAKRLILVLYMRVSTSPQEREGNLENRCQWLILRMKRRELSWHSMYTEVASGKTLDKQKRVQLVNAFETAQMLQAENPDAIVAIVTNTLDRFLRPESFDGRDGTEVPTPEMLADLQRMAGPILLATVLHPDSSLAKVKRHEQRMAIIGGKPVGRPKKQTRRRYTDEEKAKIVEEVCSPLRRKQSLRYIAKDLGIPYNTFRPWLRVRPLRGAR